MTAFLARPYIFVQLRGLHGELAIKIAYNNRSTTIFLRRLLTWAIISTSLIRAEVREYLQGMVEN